MDSSITKEACVRTIAKTTRDLIDGAAKSDILITWRMMNALAEPDVVEAEYLVNVIREQAPSTTLLQIEDALEHLNHYLFLAEKTAS
jgi:hypothetical protein